MNIQDEAIKIHSKYGTTEKANYEIQLLCEKYAKEYHEQQLKILNISDVINSATTQMIHYDLAIKANELMKQHNTMKVEDFRELPEVKRLWNAMDVIKEHYL